MSELARRSALVLALLFGLLFAVGIAVMWRLDLPVWGAVIFAVVVVLLQFALGPWIIELLYKIRWTTPEGIHPEFAAWYYDACARRGIPPPRIGVIDDGNPNAFTYGHTPADARVVVTQGLLDMLTPAEVHAVVAHELGHVANRDFIVMTVASAVPLILYVLYVWTRGSRRDRNGYTFLVAIGAYVAYVASQYIVLLLSRVREYFADESAALTTHDPNALASALVKICYGLSAGQAEQAAEAQMTPLGSAVPAGPRQPALSGTAMALGIASPKAAGAFAIAASDATGRFSLPVMVRAMQWDLKNPWAKWFELHSTHPLAARRIHALGQVARKLQIAPAFDFSLASAAQTRYTGALATEILVVILPSLAAFLGLLLGGAIAYRFGHVGALGLALVGGGLGYLLQMAYAYPRVEHAAPRTVESLVGEVDVCHVTAIPCVVEGEIIGRGVPGLVYSDDLVMRDATGFLTLQYRQPFGFMELLFGWLNAQRYVGRPARVHGWYRRAPSPYIEISHVELLDGPGGITCYYRLGNVALAWLVLVIGAALCFVR